MAPEVIDITKPGGDEVKTQLRQEKDQQLQGSIPSGISTFVPDEKTRAAAETLEALQGQQQTAGLLENSSLLTPPGEAGYFDCDGLMENV